MSNTYPNWLGPGTLPITQFGTASGSGASGSVVVNLPIAYTSGTSYVAFVSMEDSDPAEMSVVRNSASQIQLYWAQAGAGSHTLAWQTIGT
jgi:hypothetical protein